MTESDGRAGALLRAAGHVESAELLERLDNAIDAAKPAAGEANQPPPDPQRQHDAAEAERQAEAQVMLRALRDSGVVGDR